MLLRTITKDDCGKTCNALLKQIMRIKKPLIESISLSLYLVVNLLRIAEK